MSADFTTTIKVKGTKEECLEIMKVLCYCSKEMEERHRKKRDCWYLGASFDSPENEVEKHWQSGIMKLEICGTFGAFGSLEDVDLFQKIADAAPTCSFTGSISGWDSGGDQSQEAELKDGLLYFRSSYIPFADEYYEDEDEDDEYEDEMDEDRSGESAWDTVYDPKTKTYSQVTLASKGDSVVVTVSLFDKNGVKHELSLMSDDIEDPINLNCCPEDFLADKSVENVFKILLDAIDGEGAEKCKKDIIAFRTEVEPELKNSGLSKLELIKIHDHKAPLFFDWLRADLKKLAKKVCTCTETDKQKIIEEFTTYLMSFEPQFPSCEFTG